jgi:hypothetical protein
VAAHDRPAADLPVGQPVADNRHASAATASKDRARARNSSYVRSVAAFGKPSSLLCCSVEGHSARALQALERLEQGSSTVRVTVVTIDPE